MRSSNIDGRTNVAVVGDTIHHRDRNIASRNDRDFHSGDDILSELTEWKPILSRLSISWQTAVGIYANSRRINCDFQTALLNSGIVGRDELIRAIADDLGLNVIEMIDPRKLIINDDDTATLLRSHSGHVPVKLVENDGSLTFVISSERIRLAYLRARIHSSPSLASRLKLADAQVLRTAIVERAQPVLVRTAVSGLFERFPEMSARVVANAWQGSVVGIAATALPVGIVLAPQLTLATLHGLATFFFFACVALRFAAVASLRPANAKPPIAPPSGQIPVYSVLVALYKEDGIVPDLLIALDRIVWPRDRLEIKLVCEEEDSATLAAIGLHELPPHIEVIKVPSVGPRTKPKALAYALAMTSGEFIALYDAEDWPDPMQLSEAWQRFGEQGPELAVLQAPLEVSNRSESIMARMFAFEYSGLFRGLLPWLSHNGLLLPLGGTSNHFRRCALETVGGWDPFNVTEDADLGTRLARFGYRAETIASPTYEQAPTRFKVWLPQRTRWFKGWSQTWLVHMRNPLRLASDLGPRSFLIAQVLFAGMLASAILHPLLLTTLAFALIETMFRPHASEFHSILLAIDIANITCGYLSFLLLGWQTMTKTERFGFWKIVAFTPVYWVLLSYAGWRAMWQLMREPHRWEKTPHQQSSSATLPAILTTLIPAPSVSALLHPSPEAGTSLRQ